MGVDDLDVCTGIAESLDDLEHFGRLQQYEAIGILARRGQAADYGIDCPGFRIIHVDHGEPEVAGRPEHIERYAEFDVISVPGGEHVPLHAIFGDALKGIAPVRIHRIGSGDARVTHGDDEPADLA